MIRRSSAGYTIVEVMIFLVVSGGLFVSMVTLVGRRQANEEFTQAIQDLDTKLRTTLNEVGTGYYPRAQNIKCTVAGAGPIFSGSGGTEGGNEGCIVVGKVLQIKADKIRIYTLIGRRQTSAGREIETLDAGQPVVADSAVGGNTPGLTEDYNYQFQMKVSKAVSATAVGTTMNVFGFFPSLAGYDSTSLLSGSQNIQLGVLRNSATGVPLNLFAAVDGAPTITQIRNSVRSASNPPNYTSGGVLICLLGGNGKKAQINVGAGNQVLQTEVLRDSSVNATC